MGVFDSFIPLDGLIQVIYHSTSCFVLISRVERTCWNVELGLVGDGGRWWRGSWAEKDVYRLAGSKVSELALEKLATRLADWIIAGELAIGNWTTEKGAEIKLQIDPSGSGPVAIPLVELPTEEASAQAINILKKIALQVQSHKCRISGPRPTISSASSVVLSKPSETISSKEVKDLQKAQERVKLLEDELVHANQAATDKRNASPSKTLAPKPPPGASRANPTRQKRKIAQAEFESD